MGLAEILAKKKALAEQAEQKQSPAKEEPATQPSVAPASVAPVAESKPLSFAEKMALKKQQEAAAQGKAAEPPKAEAPISPIAALAPEEKPAAPTAPLSFAEKLKAQKQAIQEAQAKAPEPVNIDPERIPSDPDEAQSFVDIVTKIHSLKELMEDDLKGGMTALKEAIKKNPSAADLLLDEELGLMVTALRRMRGIVISEVTKEKKPGAPKKAKAKEVALTSAELEAAWAEMS